jgi:hypothetical protein
MEYEFQRMAGSTTSVHSQRIKHTDDPKRSPARKLHLLRLRTQRRIFRASHREHNDIAGLALQRWFELGLLNGRSEPISQPVQGGGNGW